VKKIATILFLALPVVMLAGCTREFYAGASFSFNIAYFLISLLGAFLAFGGAYLLARLGWKKGESKEKREIYVGIKKELEAIEKAINTWDEEKLKNTLFKTSFWDARVCPKLSFVISEKWYTDVFNVYTIVLEMNQWHTRKTNCFLQNEAGMFDKIKGNKLLSALNKIISDKKDVLIPLVDEVLKKYFQGEVNHG